MWVGAETLRELGREAWKQDRGDGWQACRPWLTLESPRPVSCWAPWLRERKCTCYESKWKEEVMLGDAFQCGKG